MSGAPTFLTPAAQPWRIPSCPARPYLRVVSILGRTAWTASSSAFTHSPTIALHLWARSVLQDLGLEIEIKGRLRNDPQLWVSNHLSWLDPVILLSLRPMVALAKDEVAHYPLIGSASRRLGLIFVDRLNALSRASAIIRLANDLRSGQPMLLFPEGTTTAGQGLAPLQEGGLRAAFRCGAAVQTIRLSSQDPTYPWLGQDALLPHLMKVASASTGPLRLEAGEVLEPRWFDQEEHWIEAIRQQLIPHS